MAAAALVGAWLTPQAAPSISLLRTAKAVVLISVSAILYRRRRTDPVAAMLALAFLLWTISSSVDFLANSVAAGLVDRVRFLLFALALLLFPDGDWRPSWTPYLGLAIVATFLLGVAETCGFLSAQLFLPIAIGCVLAALAALMWRYRSLEPGVQRQQLKWVALGLVVGISLILLARAGAALTAGMEMPVIGAVALEAMFQLGIIVLALGFLTSLLRFRLYDAEAAISRSVAYAGLTLALVGTFAASEALIELFGQRFFGMAIGNVSGAAAAAVAAMMLTPLHGRISSWAERQFQHDLAQLKGELPDLLAVLSSTASVKRLADVILPRIEEALHATRIALVVDGKLAAAAGVHIASARRLLRGWRPPETVQLIEQDEQDFFSLRLALRCPLGSVRGWLLLGPRPDGSHYGRDDLDALAEVAPSLQRALFMVAEREAVEKRHRAERRLLARTLVALESRLEAFERDNRARALG